MIHPSLVDPLARWITHPAWVEPEPELTRTPLLRRRFLVDSPPVLSVLNVAGLGVWTATLDGVAVSDDALEPGSTEYRSRVAVVSYDVTERLTPGPHELCIELGEGPAHVREATGRYTKFVHTRYSPRLVASLAMTDGSGDSTAVVTDGDWESTLGRTSFSHWYGGEDYDARLAVDEWEPAWDLGDQAFGGPALWRRAAPPVRVVDTFEPVQRTPLDDGGLLVDFGVNHAGRPVLSVGSEVLPGTTITLWPAENTAPGGHVDQTSAGQPIFDRYTAAGQAASWRPSFRYHGYRYLELQAGDPRALDGVAVVSEQLRSDNRRVGSFHSSNATLNRIYGLTDRAVQSNLFSVLTDCPHREKLGWLEQMHLVFAPLAHYFDVSPQLSDMVTHMMDAQTEQGLVPDIAPELTRFGGGFRDDVNWGSAIAQLPLLLWRTYGDLAPATLAWPAIQRYLGYLDDQLEDGLLPRGLSDWKTLDPSTPSTLVHGHGQLKLLRSTAELAVALGHDPAPFHVRGERLRARLAAEHVRADGGVGSGSQASYALALDAGLLPEPLVPACRALLVDQLATDDHRFTVGEIGLPALFRALSAAGRHDLLHELVTRGGGPGYVNMIETGCTALAETWEVIQGEASANHFMLGYVVAWLTEDVAGLRQAPSSVGWRAAVVEPRALRLLDHASVGYDSPAGRYAVEWRWDRDLNRVILDVTVPERGTAELRCPQGFRVSSVRALGPGEHRVELVPQPGRELIA